MRSFLMIFMILATSGGLAAQEVERRMTLAGVGEVFIAQGNRMNKLAGDK